MGLPTENDPKASSDTSTPNDDEKVAAAPTFPEGGIRAWSVAAGHAGAMFCTFGYINSFGFVHQPPGVQTGGWETSRRAMLMCARDRVYQSYYKSNQLQSSSDSKIAWIGSLQLFFIFIGTLFGGPLFDRYGGKVSRPRENQVTSKC